MWLSWMLEQVDKSSERAKAELMAEILERYHSSPSAKCDSHKAFPVSHAEKISSKFDATDAIAYSIIGAVVSGLTILTLQYIFRGFR